MAKDEAWFQSIKWDDACRNECHKENNGTCPMRSCAELHYDDNGNLIHFSSVSYDGDYMEVNERR